MRLRTTFRIGIHIITWLTITYILNQVFRLQFHTFHLLNGTRTESVIVHTFPALITIAALFKALFFYSNALPYVRRLTRTRSWHTYFAVMAVLGIIVAGVQWLVIELWITDKPPLDTLLWPDLLGYALTFGAGLTYILLQEWDRAEKQAQMIATEQARTELDLLKAQINPHFFLNTLNNLYSMAQEREVEQLEDGILRLSEMMRYILYECRAERVTLLKELEYIKSYIGITLARYRQDGHIKVTLDADKDQLQNFLIAPVILIPFIENAFKHGVSLKKPSSIQIALKSTINGIEFSVRNTDHSRTGLQLDHGGIGIANVRRRLEMLYANNYTLQIQKSNGFHYIKLQLGGL